MNRRPAFPKFQRLIYQQVKLHSLKYPFMEFDELLSIAVVAFFEAAAKYDPEKGKFSTFLVHIIHWKIIGAVSIAAKLHATMVDIDSFQDNSTTPLPAQLYSGMTPYDRVVMSEILDSISDDGKSVIQLLTEKIDYGNTPPKKVRGMIYKKLRQMGWSWRRIWDVFSELKTVAGTV